MEPYYKDLCDDRYGAPGTFTIFRCNSCGLGRTYPTLGRKEIGEFYKKYYPLSSLTATQVKRSVIMWPKCIMWLMGVNNAAHRNIKPGTEVLDIGSGTGESLLEIKKYGAHAYGVEPDPNAQKIAKVLNLKVCKGFISDNPFPTSKFDFVTASQVFEHEPDPENFLISARRKMKENGKIILSFPNPDSFYRKIFGKNWLNWHVPYHINFFTKKSLVTLTNKTKLRIVNLRTITPNIWSVYQIERLFEKIQEGEKSKLWTRRDGGLFTKIITALLLVFITPINRIIDLFGLGDSLFVILEYA
jgi:SAM-dependent methyltransferase